MTRKVKTPVNTTFDASDPDFMMAFTAVNNKKSGTSNRSGMSDERYLKWHGRHLSRFSGKYHEKYEPMHRCTGEEFARFYEPETLHSAKAVAKLQAEGHFYCIDWRTLPHKL